MGWKILEKKYLNPDQTLFELVIAAPDIAKKAKGGNFVILRTSEQGERFPLTVADYDRIKGTITIVIMRAGKSTTELSLKEPGDEILDFVGPLGKCAPIDKYDHPVVLVGGGVGIAPIYPQAKELKEKGNHVIAILGARTKELIFWEEKFTALVDEVIITTDDGTYGQKGFVTDRLREQMEKHPLSHVIAIGPIIMMKFVALLTKGNELKNLPKVPTTVSLNPIMVDGTGMCGGCRFLTLDGQTKFACVDGPDVDGHNVDYDNLIARNSRFQKVETDRLEKFNHECRLMSQANNPNAEGECKD
ncbi:MAG: sulfide/dihydroorotate dehydrogenase-like FAD/NAD-binding protein [Promethearchaeota archaeon]|nr:MAG: sulfide/dihydroorotate dehydrogenase-like FAD/NAD-binding protein [Candidatus Lokiarchaeota archaeon]